MPRGYMVLRELPNSPEPKQWERIVRGSPLPPAQQMKLDGRDPAVRKELRPVGPGADHRPSCR
jgi:hypothetical protein